MTFTAAELRLMAFCARVAVQVVPANHPAAEHLPVLLDRIERTEGDSLERTSWDRRPEKIIHRITTGEAASRLGITRRAILQRITRGTLRAQRIGRYYFVDPKDLE